MAEQIIRPRNFTDTATDSDLQNADNYLWLDTANKAKKVEVTRFANQIALETTNGNVTALTTYAQNVAHSIAPEFDPTRTLQNQYKRNECVMYQGKTYKFVNDHYGSWADADAIEVPVSDFISYVLKILFDNSTKTITAASNGFYYFRIPFVKGMSYRIETTGTSTYAVLVNKKTSSATGQTIYEANPVNTDFVANEDYLYLRVYITNGSSVSVFVKDIEYYITRYTEILRSIVRKDTLSLETSYHKSSFAPIVYEKGVRYKFINTGSNGVNVYLVKSKSTQQSEIAVDLGNLSVGKSIIYQVEDVEFSWLSIYGTGSNPGTYEIKVEQEVSNVNLAARIDSVKENVDDVQVIVNKNYFEIDGEYSTTVQHPIKYMKGLIYKFINTGDSPLSVYLMKSKSTQQSEIAVTLSQSLAAGSYIIYEVEDVEFSWMNIYGMAGGGGVYKIKVEQLISNEVLNEKINLLQTEISAIVANSIPSFSIIGDSYSTYQGFLADPNAASYYMDGGGSVQLANGVKDTWWFKLANKLKSAMFANNSWSGSTISDTVRPGLPATSSMVYRVDHAFSTGQVGNPKPNMIIFFGGTNDSWLDNPMGVPQYSGWTSSDLLETLPALCYCIDKLLKYNPGTRIVFVLNTGLSTTFNDGVATICEHYGIDLVALNNIDKSNGHPTSTGMQQICDQIYAAL